MNSRIQKKNEKKNISSKMVGKRGTKDRRIAGYYQAPWVLSGKKTSQERRNDPKVMAADRRWMGS